jgi:hypothetical protein
LRSTHCTGWLAKIGIHKTFHRLTPDGFSLNRESSYFLNHGGGMIRPMSKPTKHSKREVRRIRRLRAWIMVQGRMNSECQVLDISRSGVKLVAATPLAVPDRFDLAFFQGDQPRGCEVIWRHGKVLGVRFTQ